MLPWEEFSGRNSVLVPRPRLFPPALPPGSLPAFQPPGLAPAGMPPLLGRSFSDSLTGVPITTPWGMFNPERSAHPRTF